MSNSAGNQEIFSSQTVATAADSVEYDENIYDDYYADDQYAAVAVEGSKGEQARNVLCPILDFEYLLSMKKSK